MNIEKELNAMIEEAKAKAAKSGVGYGCIRAEVNVRNVEAKAITANNCRSFRMTWMVDGKRCKAEELVSRIK